MLTDSFRQPFFTLCVMLLHFHYTNGDMKVICLKAMVRNGTNPTEKCTHVINEILELGSKITFEQQFSNFKNDTDNSKKRILIFRSYSSVRESEVYERAANLAKKAGYHGILVPFHHTKEDFEKFMEPILQHDLELYIPAIRISYDNDSEINLTYENYGNIIKNKSNVNLIVKISPTSEQFMHLVNGSEVDTQRPYWEERINFLNELGFPTSNLIIMVEPLVFKFYMSEGLLVWKERMGVEQFCMFMGTRMNLTSTNNEREIKRYDLNYLLETNNYRKNQLQFLVDINIGGFCIPAISAYSISHLKENEHKHCMEEVNVFIKQYIDVVSKSD